MRVESESGLDVGVLEAVLACGSVDARITLARQLAGLIADPDASALEKEQVVPILLKLVADESREVRRYLAEELATIHELNPDVIFAVIADEDDIAIPFLNQTPALNGWHMLAILRVGDDKRQCAIARRRDISDETAAYIAKQSSASVVVALLTNDKAKLGPTELNQIYNRLGQNGDVVEALLDRADLPVDIRIAQAKRAAVRMRQMMAERGWLPAYDAAALVADAEDMAVITILKDAGPQGRKSATAALALQNMLTPQLVVRAACLGELAVLAAALSHLTGRDEVYISSIITAKGSSGIRGIINRSGLPASTHKIIAAAADVFAQSQEEGITLDAHNFGRRLLESLMLNSGAMKTNDQSRDIDLVSRYADDRVRKIAQKLKSDMLRAA